MLLEASDKSSRAGVRGRTQRQKWVDMEKKNFECDKSCEEKFGWKLEEKPLIQGEARFSIY